MKLWGGRFAKETAKAVDSFHSSINFDWRLHPYDIAGSIAHVKMLAQQGIISASEEEAIAQGLREIGEDLAAGRIELDPGAEDIHMNIELILTERIGPVAGKLHTGRSRNDQVATDMRLYVKDAIDELLTRITSLQEVFLIKATEHLEVIMPGYTHLQRAQPILFAHHMLAYFEMLERDKERLQDCRKRTDYNPLGSGALAGVTYPIDREATTTALGFSGITANSIDAVSDRDFLIELAAAASICMMHLSRLCEEIVLWSTTEFGFVTLDDSYTTGSSIMPQKKNPDIAELIRGKTGRVYGSLVALLTMMKGLPLAYNKDMQEDKEPVFDLVDTLKGCLEILAPMLRTMEVNDRAMRQAATQGYLNATDLADYLVGKGMPFREAHAIVGKLVLACLGQGKNLEELTLAELHTYSHLFADDVGRVLDVGYGIRAREVPGGTNQDQVKKALERAWQHLNHIEQNTC